MLIRKTLLLTTLLILSLGLQAQTDSLFSKFLELFPGKKIDAIYQENILKIKGPFPEQRLQYESRTAKKILESNDNFILLSVDYHCGGGGMCEGVDLYSFKVSGELMSNIILSEDFGDCGFNNTVEQVIFEESLIITQVRKWKGDCNEEITDSEEIQINTYEIQKTGEINLTTEQKIDLTRQYFHTSTELLTTNFLRTLTKDELATMRNELFASYGYQFKSDKWSSYFEQQNWYNPTRNSVPESELSLIEQRNLQLIKTTENRK